MIEVTEAKDSSCLSDVKSKSREMTSLDKQKKVIEHAHCWLRP